MNESEWLTRKQRIDTKLRAAQPKSAAKPKQRAASLKQKRTASQPE